MQLQLGFTLSGNNYYESVTLVSQSYGMKQHLDCDASKCTLFFLKEEL